VFGGLTFGGGPIGNYMSHAVASMVDRLRDQGRFGLLYANGGYATSNHSIVLSSAPFADQDGPLDFDFQAEADRLRGPTPEFQEHAPGPALIETYTLFYERTGAPSGGVVVARTPGGARTLARVPPDDTGLIGLLTRGDPGVIGLVGDVVAIDGGDQDFRRRP
jgi:acetyl-CoA C-acetyltransferase